MVKIRVFVNGEEMTTAELGFGGAVKFLQTLYTACGLSIDGPDLDYWVRGTKVQLKSGMWYRVEEVREV